MYTDLQHTRFSLNDTLPSELVEMLQDEGLLDDPFEHGTNLLILTDASGRVLGCLPDGGPDPLLQALEDAGTTHFTYLHTHVGKPAEPDNGDLEQATTLTFWATDEKLDFHGLIIVDPEGRGGCLTLAGIRDLPDLETLANDPRVPEGVQRLFRKKLDDEAATPEDFRDALEATIDAIGTRLDPDVRAGIDGMLAALEDGDMDAFGAILDEAVQASLRQRLPRPQPQRPPQLSLDQLMALPRADFLN